MDTSQKTLTEAQRGSVVRILTQALADEYVLYTKTRNYHWNVTGPRFHDLHKLFESQYEVLDEKIDELAEFIRYFGFPTPATLAEFLKHTRLQEGPSGATSPEDMVRALLADHEQVIQCLRAGVATLEGEDGPVEVADLLTGLIADHGKMAWILRATAN